MLFAVVAGLVAPQPGAAQAPPAQGSLPFYPHILAALGPISSSGPILNSLRPSGSWQPLTVASLGCGHCGTYVHTIELDNVLDGRKITIHSALLYYGRGDSTVGAEGVVFAAPWLVWRQPVSPVPLPGSQQQYVPGDFACTLCAYDLRSGQAGPAQALLNLEQTTGGAVTPLTSDLADSRRVLAQVNDGHTVTLWTVDLETNATQQISGVSLPVEGAYEALLTGNTVAWTQRSGEQMGLYLYYNNTLRQLLVGPTFSNLQSTGTDLFWSTPDQVQRLTLGTGDLGNVPGASSDYKVAGNRIAWIQHARLDARDLLIIQQLDTRQPLLQAYLTDAANAQSRWDSHLAALTFDMVVFHKNQYDASSGFPQQFTVQMSWLVPPDPAFARVWDRADGPVLRHEVGRSWLWGPQANYVGLEAYTDAPNGTRLVQYYDKSRMEVNNPNGNPNDQYYVTNGLLVAEMIGSDIRMGNEATITASIPCTIPVAGDPRKDNPLTPGYSALIGVASLHGEHQAPDRRTQPVNDSLDVNGVVGTDPTHGALAHYASFVTQTGHNIPDVFWAYLTGMQNTYGFDWTFVLGYPITEGYWTQMRVGGHDYPVLIQAFQRRVLTYAPDFPAEWRVQQGNVGQHYFEWRYILNGPGR